MMIKKSYLITSITAIMVLLCIAIVIINPFTKDIWELNSKSLKKQVLLVNQANEPINLSNLTPFEWDAVYSFAPYIPKENIYKVVGYKWDNISETLSEGMSQIVFTKSGKVVCYLYGFPSNNGYGILFDSIDYKDGVAILYSKDNLHFRVTKSDGIIYLKYIK